MAPTHPSSACSSRAFATPRPTRSRIRRRLPHIESLDRRIVPATFTVTSLADSGPGTLRDAITQANAATGAANTIPFDPSVTGSIVLLSALPDLSGQLQMVGPGSNALKLTEPAPSFRFFNVLANANVAISGLTLQGGQAADGGGIFNRGTLTVDGSMLTGNRGAGGAIENRGTLTVTNSTISDNSSGVDGGGIRNFAGSMTLTNCIFTGNTASTYGGAISNAGGVDQSGPVVPGVATLTHCILNGNTAANSGGAIQNYDTTSLSVTASTIDGNQATRNGGGLNSSGPVTLLASTLSNNKAQLDGGGIVVTSGTLTATNCTITANTAGGSGGGIDIVSPATMALTDSTLSGNTSGANGGGLVNFGGNLTLQANIFANGAGGNIVSADGTFTDSGHNLFTDRPNLPLDPSDLVNTDPRLAPLASYGGPTPTQALLPGSPAIDAGVAVAGVTTDQRGIARPQGKAPDIGAFESRGFTLAPAGGDAQSAVIGSAFPQPLTVSVASPFGEPVAGGVVAFNAPATGASASLSGTSALIDTNGRAAVTATANGLVGTYAVAAQASGAPATSFTLTNLAAPSFPAPQVTGFRRLGYHAQPTELVITFSTALDPALAKDVRKYTLIALVSGDRPGLVIPIGSAVYDPVAHTVTLHPVRRLPLHARYRLTIDGTPPGGLKSAAGVFLDGAGTGKPGSDYVKIFGAEALAGPNRPAHPRSHAPLTRHPHRAR